MSPVLQYVMLNPSCETSNPDPKLPVMQEEIIWKSGPSDFCLICAISVINIACPGGGGGGGTHPESVRPCYDGAAKPLPSIVHISNQNQYPV